MNTTSRSFRRATLACAVIVTTAASAPAQSGQPGHDEHAHHQHALPEKLGKMNFPNACRAEAQAGFQRGLAFLYSFGYDEASRSFTDAAAKDPDCALAYWGLAMSQFHAIWAPPTEAEFAAGEAAAKKAAELIARRPDTSAVGKRERDWVGVVNAIYAGGLARPQVERAKAFEQAMAGLVSRWPQDDEAAIFHALGLLSIAYNSPPDKTYALQKRAAGILNGLLPRHPEHPGVAHYMIHSFDYPALAPLAVDAARAYAKIAPDSPHALHMPSHIFVRLGMWQDVVDSNNASYASAQRMVERTRPGATSYEGLHATDYLTYAYLQAARDDRARELVERVATVETLDTPTFSAAYSLAAIPSRYALERRDWAAAARLVPSPQSFPWSKHGFAEAVVHFARAVGAARSGNVEAARAAHARLAEIQTGLASGPKGGFDWATQVEINRRAAEGWLRHAEGKHEDAERLLRAAADLEDSTDKHPVTPGSVLPAREQLADLLLEHGKARAALAEYEMSLKTAPARYRSFAGAAQAAEAAGDAGAARAYHERLAALCDAPEGSPTARPELTRARQLLAAR